MNKATPIKRTKNPQGRAIAFPSSPSGRHRPRTADRAPVRVAPKPRDHKAKTRPDTPAVAGAAVATLTYQAFSKLWKRLVSRRRARELNVDLDDVWQQLVTNGRLSSHHRYVMEGPGGYGVSLSADATSLRSEPVSALLRRPAKPPAKRRNAR